MRVARMAAGPVLVVAVLVAALLVGSSTSAGSADQVGVGPVGTNVIEFTGQINQDGGEFLVFGYLTFVRGLPQDQLFADADPANLTPDRARFTFLGRAGLVGRSVNSNAFHLVARGTVDVFRRAPGAIFEDPESFAAGKKIATWSGRFQNVLAAFDANPSPGDNGIGDGVADVRQTFTASFRAGGQKHTLGSTGQRYRLSWHGWGALQSAFPPQSTLELGGNAIIPS